MLACWKAHTLHHIVALALRGGDAVLQFGASLAPEQPLSHIAFGAFES